MLVLGVKKSCLGFFDIHTRFELDIFVSKKQIRWGVQVPESYSPRWMIFIRFGAEFLKLAETCSNDCKFDLNWLHILVGCLFVVFSHETRQAVAVAPEGSSSEQTSPPSLQLHGAEHPVERLFPELRGWGLHTGFQPEPSLQAADGNSTL